MFNWFKKRPPPPASDEPQVRVYLNPLVMHLSGREEQKGSPLTEAEVLEVRDNAQFVMMPVSQARAFYASLDAQFPMPRLDPDRIWEEWQALRRGPDAASYGAALERAISATVQQPARIIDYAHKVAGVLYHGTLSDLDGRPQASWTYEVDEEPVTREQPLTDATLSQLWQTLDSAEVFQRSLVRDADAEIDPHRFHVVGAILMQPGQAPQRRIFQTPADEGDGAFVEWLAAIGRPVG